jgi:ketosteroid isomerase-like protein
MNANEALVRELYAARGRRDWLAVRTLLAPDVAWHEADGNADYAGTHHGREQVAALLQKLVDVTDGTFTLEPQMVISTAEHVAAAVRWSAERRGTTVEGNDLAVFRIAAGRIAAAWFFPDGYDPQALSAVFSFAERR